MGEIPFDPNTETGYGEGKRFMKKRTRILSFALALFLAAVSMVPAAASALTESPEAPPNESSQPAAPLLEEDTQAAGAETTITIYHTNDIHGNVIEKAEDGVIGLARLAALRKNTPNAFLVDVGDSTRGTPLTALASGGLILNLMDLAGYDLMTAGSHDFSLGADQLQNYMRPQDAGSALSFPILAANVWREGAPLLAGSCLGPDGALKDTDGCHVILEAGGRRIGFFGLTTTAARMSANTALMENVEFRDELETAKEQIDLLTAEGVDAVIGVCHMGIRKESAPCTSRELAEALAQDPNYAGTLTAILDGRSHTGCDEVVGGTRIVQTVNGLTQVGRLELVFDGSGNVTTSETTLDLPAVAQMAEPDPDVAGVLQGVWANLEEALDEVIGETPVSLWGGYVNQVAEARLWETNLGDLAAAAFVEAAKQLLEGGQIPEADRGLPVVAVEDGGSLCAPIANGTVTCSSVFSVFSMGNSLVIKKITPQILYQLMELSVSDFTGQDGETGTLSYAAIPGSFLQVGGMSFTFDPAGAVGSKVKEILLDGESAPLDRDDAQRELFLVSNESVMNGGGYEMLKSLPVYAEPGMESDTMLAAFLSLGPQEPGPGTAGRIRTLGAYQPKDYTAMINLVDEEGNPVPDREVSYYVDGLAAQAGKSGPDGRLRIPLSDGPHGIRLARDQKEIYVCNYSGSGLIETGGERPASFPTLTYLADGSCDPVAEYRILYELDGGKNSPDNPQTYTREEILWLKSPSKEHCIFGGWYLDPEFTNKIEKLSGWSLGSVTLYAKWIRDLKEPNDTREQALETELPFRIEGMISSANDQDYYTFTLAEEARVNLRLEQPEARNLYVGLTLYDENGTELANSKTLYGQSITQVLQPGIYYILADSINGGHSEMPYTLRGSKIADTALDFSEQNMVVSMLHPDAPHSWTYEKGINGGGHLLTSTAYLARWDGPVAEEEDPYPEYVLKDGRPVPGQEDIEVRQLAPSYHMQKALFLPQRRGPLDNDHLKAAVYTYGALDVGYVDIARLRIPGFLRDEDNYYYYYLPEDMPEDIVKREGYGHGVSLVGWDDTISREKFRFTLDGREYMPEGDGAFILKNSWGGDWGDEGYFYISYYCSGFCEESAAVYLLEEKNDNYNTVYQYDMLGATTAFTEASSEIYGANVFTARGAERLRAVSFTTLSENMNYDIYVQVNDGERQHAASGFQRYGGYYTVRLDKEIALKQGDIFTVIIKYTSRGGRPGSIALESPLDPECEKAVSAPGQSYLSADGEEWLDLYEDYKANVCLKAFTYNEELGPARLVQGVSGEEEGQAILAAPLREGPVSGLREDERFSNDTDRRWQTETEEEGGAYARGRRAAPLTTLPSQEEAPLHRFPERFDLRKIGAVSPVKNQYGLGACWAFSAVHSLESTLMRNNNAAFRYPLSVELSGAYELLLDDEHPTAQYRAMAQILPDETASDLVLWSLSGDLDCIEVGDTRSRSGAETVLFTAKQAGQITVTAVSAADQLRTNTIVVTIRDERTAEEPGEDPGENPGQEPGEDPGKTPGQEPGEDPGKDPGQNPGGTTGNTPGGTTGNTGNGTTPAVRPSSGSAAQGAQTGDPFPVLPFISLHVTSWAVCAALIKKKTKRR